MTKYSVVISPPDTVIEAVRQLKQQLRQAIGWYHSVNALAHITFCEFHAGTDTLARQEAYIARFAAGQSPVTLRFDHTGIFASGAFYLAPDEASGQLLGRMMKDFQLGMRLPAYKPPATPHLSISRRLGATQLPVAGTVIGEVDISFYCEDIVLRRFNETRRQYDIYRRFPFGKV